MIERLQEFIKSQGISTRAFEQTISASDGMIRRAINNKTDIQSKWLSKIADNFPNLNLNWLITGQGEMLLNTPQNSINNVYGSQNIAGSINGGSMVNISMPETGTQKIIKPNGEVEIQREDPAIKDEDSKLAELQKELQLMKQKLAFMEDNMKIKDDLIASLKDTIELLRHK